MSPGRPTASALILILLLSSAARAAEDSAYNARAHPFSGRHAALLFNGRYQVKPDGTVWSPDGTGPLRESEIPYLLERLESAQRLKALLRINLILSRSEGEKKLTAAEKEDIRRIARESWPLFALGTRKDFKGYFTIQELTEMNKDPAPTESKSVLPLKDQEPPEEAAAPEGPKPETQPQPAAPAQATALMPSVLLPLKLQTLPAPPPASTHSLRTPRTGPFGEPPPAAAAPVLGAAGAPNGPAAPRPKAFASAGPTPAWAPSEPGPKPIAPAPAAQPTPSAIAPSAGTAAPSASTAAATAAAAPPSQPLELQVSPLPPPPREIPQPEFEKFLTEAPYGRDAKNLLKLISEKAPAFARSRALNAVTANYPQIVFDPTRAAPDLRGALLVQESPSGQKSYTIALSPGPLLYSRKKLFGSATVLLPDPGKFYASLHLSPPDLEAAGKDSVALKQEKGEWGETRSYADGSRRGSFSAWQQAGTLLRKLLRLDAKLGGWDASTYAAEAYARAAQWLFYARLRSESNDDGFLDPETRRSYRLWLEHPAEYRDDLVHSLSAGRAAILDPRKGGPDRQIELVREALSSCESALAGEKAAQASLEREALKKDALAFNRAGLIDSGPLEESQKAIEADFAAPGVNAFPKDAEDGLPNTAAAAPKGAESPEKCLKHWESQAAGLRLASVLLHEMEEAERKFREEKEGHAAGE